MALIKDYNQDIIRFSNPTFHCPTIPIFHWVSIGKHHLFGVKSKPGSLGQDFLIK
jgi:hypothetical protein